MVLSRIAVSILGISDSPYIILLIYIPLPPVIIGSFLLFKIDDISFFRSSIHNPTEYCCVTDTYPYNLCGIKLSFNFG